MTEPQEEQIHNQQEVEANEVTQEQSIETEIFDMIAQLNQQRVELESEGNYLEAAKVKDKLHKLGEEFERRKLIELRQKHHQEKDQLEMDFQKELDSCNQFWNNKIEQYKSQSQQLEEQLMGKHTEKLLAYEEDLRQNMPKVGKMTPEVLNLEYQIHCLVKEQRYREADTLQKKLFRLKEQCLARNDKLTQERMRNLIEHFISKQNNELSALRKKIDSGREELLKAREKDYQKLVAKYRVLRENLDDSQILEYQKIEKNLKLFKPSSNLFNKSYQLQQSGVSEQ